MFGWRLLGMRPIIWRGFCWQTLLTIGFLASFNPPALAQQAAPRSAMVFFWAEDIERPGSINWRPLGSGFLVSDQGVVLTAKHVIKSVVPGERIIASISDKSTFPVPIDDSDVQCAMANRDACAVRVPPGAIPAAVDRVFDVECGALGLDTKLRAMGFTGGGDRFGGVIQPRGEVVGSAMRAGLIPTDLNLVPTMSGGPVLNSRGHVVAIVKGADSTSDNLTFVTPVIGIKPILDGLNVQCERQGIEESNPEPKPSKTYTLQDQLLDCTVTTSANKIAITIPPDDVIKKLGTIYDADACRKLCISDISCRAWYFAGRDGYVADTPYCMIGRDYNINPKGWSGFKRVSGIKQCSPPTFVYGGQRTEADKIWSERYSSEAREN